VILAFPHPNHPIRNLRDPDVRLAFVGSMLLGALMEIRDLPETDAERMRQIARIAVKLAEECA
jgi:hypothetical protein